MLARLMLTAAVAALLVVGCKSSTTEPANENKTAETGAPEVKPAGISPQARLAELNNEFSTRVSDIQKKARGASAEDQAALRAEFMKLPDEFAAKMKQLAEENPGDPAAAEALVWIVRNGRNQADARDAFDRLKTDYADSEGIAALFEVLPYLPLAGADEFAQSVAESNPHRSAQGMAIAYLGQKAQQQDDSDKAIELLSRVESEFGDVKVGNTTLAEMVAGTLFELRNLRVGCEAPDIDGEDIDGVAFKLSDYRGKVVMIDFWGNW